MTVQIEVAGTDVDQVLTPRLRLNRLRAFHLGALEALHSNEQTMAALGGTVAPTVTKEFVRANLVHWIRFGFGLWMVADRNRPGEFIGWAALRRESEPLDAGLEPAVDLAVLLDAARRGRGLGTELTRTLVALAARSDVALAATCAVDDAAGRRVLEKVGFAYRRDLDRHRSAWSRYHWPDDAVVAADLVSVL